MDIWTDGYTQSVGSNGEAILSVTMGLRNKTVTQLPLPIFVVAVFEEHRLISVKLEQGNGGIYPSEIVNVRILTKYMSGINRLYAKVFTFSSFSMLTPVSKIIDLGYIN